MSEPVVAARDLCLWYGSFQALDQVSFEVGFGEIVSLIGPSRGTGSPAR
jgi:ABC-type branched-subunit amino acid transport system ATPase component